MQVEILETAHPVQRIARRRLIEGIHLDHRFPALGVVQIGEMMQETGELHPAEWIDRRDRLTPGEQGHLAAPCSSAVAALSKADAPAPSTPIFLPASSSKSIRCAVWA